MAHRKTKARDKIKANRRFKQDQKRLASVDLQPGNCGVTSSGAWWHTCSTGGRIFIERGMGHCEICGILRADVLRIWQTR